MVAEVLVVDVVELVLLQQVQHVVELERSHALRLEQDGEACHEVVEVGHVGHHVVGGHQVGGMAHVAQLAGAFTAKEHHLHGDAQLAAFLGHVGGGLHAQHGHALGQEPAQQVAVVGGDLDHLAVGAQLEALGHVVGIALAVVQHGLHVGREVGVVREDGLTALELLQLHQEAVAADIGMQREERLHLVEVFRLADGIGHGRHAQVGHGVTQLGTAETALGVGGGQSGQILAIGNGRGLGCRHGDEGEEKDRRRSQPHAVASRVSGDRARRALITMPATYHTAGRAVDDRLGIWLLPGDERRHSSGKHGKCSGSGDVRNKRKRRPKAPFSG